MPRYDIETNELVYTSAESEPFGCPVCGAEQAYDESNLLCIRLQSPWKCPECGATGSAYDKLTFDGHRVALATLSPEMRQEFAADETIRKHCLIAKDTVMPTYEETTNELFFSKEESAGNICPVCGSGELDYGMAEHFDDGIVYPWNCGDCGSAGKEYGTVAFDGHNVEVCTMPVEKQAAFLGVRTICINRQIGKDDLVLSAVEDGSFPCLPGRVKDIDMLGTQVHTTGNTTDDVHVDFTGDYSDRRKREIIEADARRRGCEIPFEEICLDDVIMDPSCLICISGIGEQTLRAVMESEENALRYAVKAVLVMR